jgi:protein TonB
MNDDTNDRYFRGVWISLLVHGAIAGLAFLLWTRPMGEWVASDKLFWEVDMFASRETPPEPPIPDTPPEPLSADVEPTMETVAEMTSSTLETGGGGSPAFGAPSIEAAGDISAGTLAIPANTLLGSVSGSGGFGNGSGTATSPMSEMDTGLMPTVRIQPSYPEDAKRRKIEGWVRVEMTVLEDGSVADAKVREASPSGVFDQAALRAIAQWKFRPPIRDGKPARRRAGQTLRFELT